MMLDRQDFPALDTGSNAQCPATDQRGKPRTDGACDIGAFEIPPDPLFADGFESP